MNTGKYNPNDLFSPSTQIEMIIDLLKGRGIDPNNMTVEDMTKAGGEWASLTPELGQSNTTADQSFNTYLERLNRLTQ
jgi:muramidase (phage lysozyme)